MDQGTETGDTRPARPTDDAPELPDTATLKAELNRERQRVALPWPSFAALLDFNLSTVYKIAAAPDGERRAHMTTRQRLTQKLADIAKMTPEEARERAKTLPVPKWATRAGRKPK